MKLLTFRKERADAVLSSLLTREPLAPPADGWTQSELLHLSAAALVIASLNTEVDSDEPFEHVEAKTQTSFDDCFMALGLYTDLTVKVHNNIIEDDPENYDSQFDPTVTAQMVRDGDDRTIRIVSGGKKQ